MPRRIKCCPFCGRSGVRTKEHVWAQWLHETDGARALLDGTHGERIPRPLKAMQRGIDGRYEVQSLADGRVAKWLPNVAVDVCADCNNGWMSNLEAQVKNLLEPFFRTKQPIRLKAPDMALLATWATKSWMAYALIFSEQFNPFMTSEYRHIAATQSPLGERCNIWLMHSNDEGAHVGMGVSGTLFTFGPPASLEVRDNAGFAYLAASTLVMFMALLPPDAPAGMLEVFQPPVVKTNTVRRASPSPRPQYFPLGPLPPGALAALLRYPEEFHKHLGLPASGLKDEDISQVMQKFLDGASPSDLRHEYGDGDD